MVRTVAQGRGNPYFEGKIDFLLSFAGITRDNVKTMSHDPDVLDAFDKYLELTKMAFERQDTNLPDTSLLIDVRRALLTKGDYSMRKATSATSSIQETMREPLAGGIC